MGTPEPHRMTIDDLLARSRECLNRLTPAEAAIAIEQGSYLIDVRTSEQRAADGAIPGASVIGLNVLEWRVDPDSPDKVVGTGDLHDQIILICNQGFSSSLAAARLQSLGFTRATDVVGGFQAWKTAGLQVLR